MAEYVVSSVVLTPEGIEVSFMELPGDVRGRDGTVIRTRSYAVAEVDPAYGDQVREIREALRAFVEDVDEDWATTDVFVPAGQLEELDEDEGMGSG